MTILTRLALGLLIAGLTISCSEQEKEPEAEAEANVEVNAGSETESDDILGTDVDLESAQVVLSDPSIGLQQKLEIKRMMSLSKMPPAKNAAYEAGISDLLESGAFDNVLEAGEIAPDFSLPNGKGTQVNLYEKLENGPLALVWYRGGWCPYCNLTLQAYSHLYNDFKKKGYDVIAISPEIPDSSYSTANELSLPFEVVSDQGNIIAEKYGLKYRVTDEVKEWYDRGFGMAKYNGEDSGTLPIAGTYIIGKNKQIIESYFLPDYRMRIEPGQILEALE